MGRFTAGMRSMNRREQLETQYKAARGNLLLAIIFTVVNCAMAALGTTTYFLFSCTFPYTMVLMGSLCTGRLFSIEEYEELVGPAPEEFLPIWMLFVMMVPAVIALAVYLLCWIFSKKRVGWLIAATVLFVIDTLFLILFYGVAVDMILDYVFHAWALFLFIRGIIAHFKRKALQEQEAPVAHAFVSMPEQGAAFGSAAPTAPADAGQPEAQPAQEPDAPAEPENSPVLHMADFSVKSRVLLEYRLDSYDVCYRRVGTINVLVVNGMVYDLIDTGRFEPPHELKARVNGHEITVGFGSDSHSYLKFDGEVIKRKIRWI